MRSACFVLALAITLVVAGGCTGKRPPEHPQAVKNQPPQQEVRFNLGVEPATLDPAFAQDNPSAIAVYQLFEGLTEKTPRGVEPAAAESWQVSPDGKTYVFKLRPARWSNGDQVTAQDFEFAWKRALDPAKPSPYAYILYPLQGAEEYNRADPAKVDGVELAHLRDAVGVRAVDDRTLEVRLREPAPYFLELTSFFTYMPVNRKAIEAGGERWAADPRTLVSNGPFKLEAWKRRNELVLAKNPMYWKAAAVRLAKLRLFLVGDPAGSVTMFSNDEIDIAAPGLVPPEDVPHLLQSGEVRRAPFLATYYLMFNTVRPPLGDARVRRALALAIDRRSLTETVTRGGEPPALAFVPPGIRNPASGQDFRVEGGDYFKDADAAEAKRLLAEAGYPDGRGFPHLILLYNTEGIHRSVMEAIQKAWKQNLGIDVTLAGEDWSGVVRRRAAGDFFIVRGGWIGDYGDPLSFLGMWTSSSPQNEAGWKSKAYDDLIAQVRQTNDQKARMEKLHQAEKLLMEEMPVAPVYFYVQTWQQRNYVRDVFIDAQGNVFFKRAYITPHEKVRQ